MQTTTVMIMESEQEAFTAACKTLELPYSRVGNSRNYFIVEYQLASQLFNLGSLTQANKETKLYATPSFASYDSGL